MAEPKPRRGEPDRPERTNQPERDADTAVRDADAATRWALADTARQVVASPAPLATIMREGRALRTRRRRARAAVASCCLLVAVTILATTQPIGGHPSRSTAIARPTGSPGATAPATSPTGATPTTGLGKGTSNTPPHPTHATVVTADQRLRLGAGYQLWLTSTSQTVALPNGTLEPHQVNGDQHHGVSEQTYDRLVSGIYVGGGTPTWVVLDNDGQLSTGPVVTLPGQPGWASFYVTAKGDVSLTQPPDITVYGATGTVLATYGTIGGG